MNINIRHDHIISSFCWQTYIVHRQKMGDALETDRGKQGAVGFGCLWGVSRVVCGWLYYTDSSVNPTIPCHTLHLYPYPHTPILPYRWLGWVDRWARVMATWIYGVGNSGQSWWETYWGGGETAGWEVTRGSWVLVLVADNLCEGSRFLSRGYFLARMLWEGHLIEWKLQSGFEHFWMYVFDR